MADAGALVGVWTLPLLAGESDGEVHQDPIGPAFGTAALLSGEQAGLHELSWSAGSGLTKTLRDES